MGQWTVGVEGHDQGASGEGGKNTEEAKTGLK